MSEIEFNPVRLKRLMDKRGVSDGKLAKLTGLGRTTIYYLSSGKNKTASDKNLRLIADNLETTIEYLQQEGDGDEDDRVAVLLPEAVRRLAQVATRLSNIRQDELLRIAESLEELEREQPTYPLPVQTMDVLLTLAKQVGAGDVLVQLQAMIPQGASDSLDDTRGS